MARCSWSHDPCCFSVSQKPWAIMHPWSLPWLPHQGLGPGSSGGTMVDFRCWKKVPSLSFSPCLPLGKKKDEKPDLLTLFHLHGGSVRLRWRVAVVKVWMGWGVYREPDDGECPNHDTTLDASLKSRCVCLCFVFRKPFPVTWIKARIHLFRLDFSVNFKEHLLLPNNGHVFF